MAYRSVPCTVFLTIAFLCSSCSESVSPRVGHAQKANCGPKKAYPYEMSGSRQVQFTDATVNLRAGDTLDRVKAILGNPDEEEAIFTKGPRDKDHGTAVKYIWKKAGLASNLYSDQYVTFVFTNDGKLERAYTNVPGLSFGTNLPYENENFAGQFATRACKMNDAEKEAFLKGAQCIHAGDSFDHLVMILGPPHHRQSHCENTGDQSVIADIVTYYVTREDLFIQSPKDEYISFRIGAGRVTGGATNVQGIQLSPDLGSKGDKSNY